jgi:hypothetical protein
MGNEDGRQSGLDGHPIPQKLGRRAAVEGTNRLVDRLLEFYPGAIDGGTDWQSVLP